MGLAHRWFANVNPGVGRRVRWIEEPRCAEDPRGARDDGQPDHLVVALEGANRFAAKLGDFLQISEQAHAFVAKGLVFRWLA